MKNKIVETLSNSKVKALTKKKILNLKSSAKKNASNKYRVCAHQPRDKIHEMFIFHEKDYFVKPHKHINKTESLFILKGSIDYIIFDKLGTIVNLYKLNDRDHKKFLFIRVSPGTYHSIIIKSKYAIFYEVTSGPFYKRDTIFANWYDTKLQNEYYLELKNQVKKFNK